MQHLVRVAHAGADGLVIAEREIVDCSLSDRREPRKEGLHALGVLLSAQAHCADRLGGRASNARVCEHEAQWCPDAHRRDGAEIEANRAVRGHSPGIEAARVAMSHAFGLLHDVVEASGGELHSRPVRDTARNRCGDCRARAEAARVRDRAQNLHAHRRVALAAIGQCRVDRGHDRLQVGRCRRCIAREQLALDAHALGGRVDAGLGGKLVNRHGNGRCAVHDRVFTEEDRLCVG